MSDQNPSRKPGKRRFEEMKFAYSGPFSRLLDSRVGRSFGADLPKHTASAENYTIGAALGDEAVLALEARFGREQDSSGRRPRKRGGRGRKKVTA